ncbi:MAG: outer membrane lipoprotein carrier protein LolA, partial [Myxococcota bacterium]
MMGFVLAVLLAAPSAQSLATDMAAAYKRGGDFSADFTQTYTDKLRGKSRTESGNLWVKADGRVRWSYTKPESKDFVFDGQQAYFYEPENAQV